MGAIGAETKFVEFRLELVVKNDISAIEASCIIRMELRVGFSDQNERISDHCMNLCFHFGELSLMLELELLDKFLGIAKSLVLFGFIGGCEVSVELEEPSLIQSEVVLSQIHKEGIVHVNFQWLNASDHNEEFEDCLGTPEPKWILYVLGHYIRTGLLQPDNIIEVAGYSEVLLIGSYQRLHQPEVS